MVFHSSLGDSKSPQVSRTLHSIQIDLNYAVVCIVSILPLISNTSSLFSKLLETVPSAPITIGITVTLIFHNFSALWQDPSICRSFLFLLFSLYGPPEWQNPQDGKFFFSCHLKVGLVLRSGLGDPFVSQNPRDFYVSHSLGQNLVCVCTIWCYCQILITCTILNRSSFPPSHV